LRLESFPLTLLLFQVLVFKPQAPHVFFFSSLLPQFVASLHTGCVLPLLPRTFEPKYLFPVGVHAVKLSPGPFFLLSQTVTFFLPWSGPKNLTLFTVANDPDSLFHLPFFPNPSLFPFGPPGLSGPYYEIAATLLVQIN